MGGLGLVHKLMGWVGRRKMDAWPSLRWPVASTQQQLQGIRKRATLFIGRQRWRYRQRRESTCKASRTRFKRKCMRKWRQLWLTITVLVSSFQLTETLHTVPNSQLILRKISKSDATRCQILRLKCTKFDFRRGSAQDPAGGANSAPPDSLAVLTGGYF